MCPEEAVVVGVQAVRVSARLEQLRLVAARPADHVAEAKPKGLQLGDALPQRDDGAVALVFGGGWRRFGCEHWCGEEGGRQVSGVLLLLMQPVSWETAC